MTTKQNGCLPVHYHNNIKSTSNSAVYQPVSRIIITPLTEKYTVGENIGRGKFAIVKKCINKQTGEVLAAKFIKKRRRGKTCRDEILREVVMLEIALDHPRLVNFKEVYETQQELILVTEYCAGGELFTECILEEKFNESDVRLLMSQILEGLAYLHNKSIVHLDLKPQNILLTDEFPTGSVKICDLGFACLVNTGEDIRDIIGTPDYVAPEVLNYDTLGLYTDMWSLGVLTYVMLTACSPFAAEDNKKTFINITSVNLDFPEDLFGNISEAAQDFIKRLLILEPSERMTARECFQHEWISGLPDPSQGLTCLNTESFSSEIQKVNPDDGDKSDRVVKSDLREKVQNQSSEMSVIESPDENVIVDDFPDISGVGGDCSSSEAHMVDFCLEVSNEEESFGVDCVREPTKHQISVSTEMFPDDDKEINDSDRPIATYLNIGLNEGVEHLETVAKNFYVQNHLQDTTVNSVNILETYSEILYAGDMNNVGSVYMHEASVSSTRAEPELDVNQGQEELNFNEQAEDSEMFSKSFIGVDIETNCLIVGDKIDQGGPADIGKDQSEILEDNEDISKSMNTAENETDTEMEESDVDKTKGNESNSSESLVPSLSGTEQTIFRFGHTNIFDSNNHFSSICQSFQENHILIKSTPFSSRKFGGNTSMSFGTSQSDSCKGQDSFSTTEDSMNNMQFGERLKRTKSGESNVSNKEEQQDTSKEIEYEWVSVPKRVKNFEAMISSTKPSSKTPTFSPKVPRSPCIGKHIRPNTHPH